MRQIESENQDDFMFMRIVAMFKIVITITINKHQVHDVRFYLKGLSLVPSSEGFTITAFLPAYLMYNNCVTHTAQASKERLEFRQRDLTKNGTKKRLQEAELTCPKAAGRPCRPSWFSPWRPLKGIPLWGHIWTKILTGFHQKLLRGSESDKITFICPSLTWSSSGRTPAPYPRTKTVSQIFLPDI